ncbi:restriction endonuclease [Salinisphaera dokdonensis CL-ES53]|uniref:Restriction endonuclease n=2 Tax=Salinisphaera TaxID=180541 RepID=A0ABV2B4L0_9GAMM
MARRRRKSDFEQWVALFAKLPWPVCLALTLPAYFGFAALVDWPIPKTTGVSEMGGVVVAQFIRVAGMIGQYAAPAMLLLAALMSLLAKRRRAQLLQTSRSISGSAKLMQMSWQDFERLVHAWFEEQRYKVAATPAGPDGGIDLILKRDGETFLVQCKQWRANRIGVSIVRELYGVMVAQGAAGGFVVGVGDYTAAAKAFATGRNIDLVDARAVIHQSAPVTQPNDAAPAARAPETPSCPRCNASMVERTARNGAKAGNTFYGCSRFPACRGTRPVSAE